MTHNDIKAQNILMFEDEEASFSDEFIVTRCPKVVIGDLGEAFSTLPANIDQIINDRPRGTECIRPPEVLQGIKDSQDRRKSRGYSHTAADTWALGCFFYELLTGEFLFHTG